MNLFFSLNFEQYLSHIRIFLEKILIYIYPKYI